MPLTRKSVSTPVKATRSKGATSIQVVTPAVNSRDGKKSSAGKNAGKQQKGQVEKQTEKNTANTKKMTKTKDADPVASPSSKKYTEKTTGTSSRDETKSEMEMSEVSNQSAKKRKLSVDITPEPESTKRTKMESLPVVPVGASPRRSSRAVIPNSRYKDMEVLDIVKKKPSSSVAVADTEKKKIQKPCKTEAMNSQPEEPGCQTNTESSSVICETEVDDLEMNEMDNILVLPSTKAIIPQTAVSIPSNSAPVIRHTTNIADDPVDMLQANNSGSEEINVNPKREMTSQDEFDIVSSENHSKDIIMKEIKTSGSVVETSPSSNSVVVATDQSVKNKLNEMESTGKVCVISAPTIQTKSVGEMVVPSPHVITVPQAVKLVNTQSRHNLHTGNKPRVIQKTVVVKPKPVQKKSTEINVAVSDGGNSSSPADKREIQRILDGMNKPTGSPMVVHTPPPRITISKKIVHRERVVPSLGMIDVEIDLERSSNEDRNNSATSTVSPAIKEKIVVKTSTGVSPHKMTDSTHATKVVKSESDVLDAEVQESKQTESSEDLGILSVHTELDDNLTAGESLMAIDEGKIPEMTGEISTDNTDDQGETQQDSNEDDTETDIAVDTPADTTVSTNDEEPTTNNEEPTKDKKKVCELIKVYEKEGSPMVAIEYVVFGDRIVPIHKPFSQTHAAVYKKRASALKKIPVKVAQTAISSLLEGIEKYNKPPNRAFTIDEEEQMEEEAESQDNQDIIVKPNNLLENSAEEEAAPFQRGYEVTLPDNPQPKPGRVLQPGTAVRPDANAGPTEIVEISQDLFAKEVYGEQEVLDPVTGQMVPESMLTADRGVDDDAGKGSLPKEDVDENSQEIIVAPGDIAVSSDKPETVRVDHNKDERPATDVDEIMKFQPENADESITDENPTPFNLEIMSEEEPAVMLQVDNSGIVLNENGTGYKTIRDIKINPAVSLISTTPSGQTGGKHDKVRSGSPQIRQVKPVRASSGTDKQREIETQTEDMDDEYEEGEESMVQSQEKITMGNSIVVVNQGDTDDNMRRTTVVMEEDGQVQEYVVVHLPEGAEIKQQEVKQFVKDPIHNEVVTMSDDGMYICVDCNHKTDKKGNWYKHRRKHLGIRPHSCTKCSYKAATSSNLKRHMQIHNDVRNFECHTCGLYFRQKIHLERHVKYKHQEKKIKCPLCDYLCSSENPDLKIHIRRRHMPQEDGSMSAFTCGECGLMTVSKKDLKQHMKFHKKGPELKLFCEFCSFVTDCESRLRRHMLIHSKEKPFQCGLCSYRASQKEHVLRHMKTQHDVEVERRPRRSLLSNTPKQKQRRSLLDDPGQPAYNVTASTEEITTSDFKLQEKSPDDKVFEKSDYSSTDKIFACNHCSMKFSKLINLYKHLFAQHKQVMPETSSNFQCVVCDFRTNNKKNLLVHMRKHNMHDHSPPTHVYSCVLCRYINPRRRNLFQHMKKKHGIEIMMKDDGYNCYITGDVVVGNQEGESGIMALSEIITTHPLVDDAHLQIIAEDGSSFHAEKISLDNIMSVEDINTYEATSPADQSLSSQITTISTTPLSQSSIAEHEAAEAIEGLQALAEQAAGVVETQAIDSDITTEIITSEIMTDGEIMTTGEETLVEESVDTNDIELSSEQLHQLSAGDYVEINGEVYKVEISQENTPKAD